MFVEIGGIPQWVEIEREGARIENPALLLIHGGPGASIFPLGIKSLGIKSTR